MAREDARKEPTVSRMLPSWLRDWTDIARENQLDELRLQTVGVGDLLVSARPHDVLITYALGSCLGLVACDPSVPCAGLLHAMLPSAKEASKVIAEQDYPRYVDRGIPRLFRSLYALGGQKSRMKVYLAGCGRMMPELNHYDIGRRNYHEARRLLWQNNILVEADWCEQQRSTTVAVWVGEGEVRIRLGETVHLVEGGQR